MPKNTIEDLRNHLFETLERLKDEDDPMDVSRAKAVCEVSQVIINSAKVEIDLVDALSARSPMSRKFFGVEEEEPALPAPRPRLAGGGHGI